MNETVCEYSGTCGYGPYFVGCGNGQKFNCPMYLYLEKEKDKIKYMEKRIENFWRGLE